MESQSSNKASAEQLHPLEAMARRISAKLTASGLTQRPSPVLPTQSHTAPLLATFVPAPREKTPPPKE